MNKENSTSILLSNKTIEDLRKIALSMGLIDNKFYEKEDYIKFIEDGQIPKISYSKDKLENLNSSDLRDIAKNLEITSPYKYKKNELIIKILEISDNSWSENLRENDDLEKLSIDDLKTLAIECGLENPNTLSKEDLIKYLHKNKHKISDKVEEIDKLDTKDLSDNATEEIEKLEKINYVTGILDQLPDGYGFLRTENYLPSENDIYVSPSQIRKFRLRTGDKIQGILRPSKDGENFNALIYINKVNDLKAKDIINRPSFDNLTPIYPKEKISLETKPEELATRLIDLIAPIGKGQRGLIVSQPKSGKTTLLKKIASAISTNCKDVDLIVLLIDERPEEVTDMKRSVKGEVVFSTFDELSRNHTKVAEMVIERAKRLVELKRDVVILVDSLTRLTRAYNLITPPSGKTLSGGIDPLSFHNPKRFFGAARNIEEGGSLTILATALVDTGSRMDDIIYEEFKGTGNMEIHLDRMLSEKRIFPAVDIFKSGTRKEELLLNKKEYDFSIDIRRATIDEQKLKITEYLLDNLGKFKTNKEFLENIKIEF